MESYLNDMGMASVWATTRQKTEVIRHRVDAATRCYCNFSDSHLGFSLLDMLLLTALSNQDRCVTSPGLGLSGKDQDMEGLKSFISHQAL